MHTVIRTSRNGSTLRRPAGFQTTAALRELVSVFGSGGEVTVIADDPSYADAVERSLGGRAIVICSEVQGNSEATLHALQYVADQDPREIYNFLEDDYWFSNRAVEIIREGVELNPDGFVTLFDDPLFYHTSADVSPVDHNTQLKVGKLCHWATTESTTMTFSGYGVAFRRHIRTMMGSLPIGSKPRDREMWLSLANHGVRLTRSIPGFSAHLETTAVNLTSSVRPERVVDAKPHRVPISVELPPRVPPYGRLLITPEVSLHMESTIRATGQLSVERLDSMDQIADRVFDFDYALIDASEKTTFDLILRFRATSIRAVYVAGGPSARWFSGRDVLTTEDGWNL